MTKSAETKSPPKKARIYLLAGIAGLAAGILSAVLFAVLPDLAKGPGRPAAETSGKALIGGPFTLTAADGKRVTEKDFLGKPTLVYFGYTSCPDICPSGLQVMSAALDKLGPKADGLNALFITIDAARDTPEVMGKYVKSFSPRIVGLSGSTEDVAAATKVYRVFARKVEPAEAGSPYLMDHSSFMYLMSANGEFMKHFPSTVSPDDLAAALEKAL